MEKDVHQHINDMIPLRRTDADRFDWFGKHVPVPTSGYFGGKRRHRIIVLAGR